MVVVCGWVRKSQGCITGPRGSLENGGTREIKRSRRIGLVWVGFWAVWAVSFILCLFKINCIYGVYRLSVCVCMISFIHIL
jgi:hypothetical protein